MSLIKIAICDDIQKELETIRSALDTYAEAHSELFFDVDEYGAAIDILHAVEKGKVYDIALLDICMPGVLGTDVAEEMLAKSSDMGIVFLTTSDEYAVTAFALNATHYLLKPFSQEQFNKAAILTYIGEYSTEISEAAVKRYSENRTLNSILSAYADKAGEGGISFSVRCNVPKELKIREIDLIALLGNMLEI